MYTPSSGTPDDSGADASTGESHGYRVDRRSFVAGTAAALTTAGLAGSGTVAAQDEVTIDASLADSEIDGGETTELSLTLSEVPSQGIYGATIDLDIDGAVAKFTGAATWDAEWTLTAFDREEDDDPSTGTVIATDAQGSIEGGTTDLDLGAVEIQGVGEGETEIGISVESLEDPDEQDIPHTVSGSSSLSVTGSGEFQPASDDASGDGGFDDSMDDGSGDGGSADDESASPGSQDDGDDGSSGDDSTDDDSTGDDPFADGGDSDDGTPGFGVAAAVTALAAGFGARLRVGGDDDAN